MFAIVNIMRYSLIMKRSEMGEKILLGLYNLFSTTEIIFSRDSLWNKIQRLGQAPSRKAFVNSFNSLQRSNFWRVAKSGKYKLTKKGIARLEQIQIRESIKKQKWDGLWRIVIFDITEDKRAVRDAVRRKLKIFGFYPLQKSVFVFPFDCQKEILALTNFFEAEDNIEHIIAKSLGGREQKVREFFNL